MFSEAVPAGWQVFFIESVQRSGLSDPVVARFAAKLADLLSAHDQVAGQLFLLGPDGRPDARLNAFFACYPMTARDTLPGRKPLEIPTTSRHALEDAGFDVIEEQQPSFLFERSALVTGEVPRTTGYEPSFPRLGIHPE